MVMMLQPATRAKLSRYLDKVWKKPRVCPIGGSSKWHVQPGTIIQPAQELPGLGFFPSETGTVPTFQVICTTCKFFHSFLLLPAIEEGSSNG
jgi:hypothetical protein